MAAGLPGFNSGNSVVNRSIVIPAVSEIQDRQRRNGVTQMALYKQKGSNVYWYDFRLDGHRIRESSKSASKTAAREAMHARRRQLEDERNGIRKPERPKR